MKTLLPKLFRYFFQGLLVVGPLGITVYVLYVSFTWLDSLLRLEDYPGLGLLIIIASITFLGYLASTILSKPIFGFLEKLLERIPLVGLIYTSVKDLIEAFVGNKKKFNRPVAVMTNPSTGFKRLGFLTQESLSQFGQQDLVAVYFPHSYNISGNLVLVPKALVEPLDASSADVMKFVVSGGVSGVE
jgi:uncharacterized membrane protein